MRRFALKILILLALVWSGWWYVATSSTRNSVTAWLEGRRASGWLAEAAVTSAGFPLRTTTVIDGLSLLDPATQRGVQVPQLDLSAPIYWPGHATIRLPAGPVILTTPEGTLTLGTGGARAGVRLRPGTALQLEALSGESRNVTLDFGEAQLLEVGSVQAEVTQGRMPETYAVNVVLTGLSLGAAVLEQSPLPPPWPDTFAPVVADMTVTFDSPWDRRALRDTRPQPRQIQITEIAASYADTGVTISGNLDVDTAGIPAGNLRLRMRNWQGMFDMAVATTIIPPEWAPTVEQVLGSMSDTDGTLDLTVTLAAGQMRVGFLPLGPAPRLVIR